MPLEFAERFQQFINPKGALQRFTHRSRTVHAQRFPELAKQKKAEHMVKVGVREQDVTERTLPARGRARL